MRILIIGVFVLLFLGHLKAQTSDTLSLSLTQADSVFLTSNFELLASRYQVRSDSALIRQAKLWDNPSFTVELGFNSTTHPKLDIGHDGQTAYSIDQLIQLAGKRNKNIHLATLNADYSEAQFQELMRTLRWQLHTAFTNYYFQSSSVRILQEQMAVLSRIVDAYKSADSSGSVAHGDYLRLAQLRFSLKNDYLSALSDLTQTAKELQQLLGISQPIKAIFSTNALPQNTHQNLADLINLALKQRPDMKMTQLDKSTALANYQLQKAIAVPDLHVGALYDKNSSVVHNYLGLSLGIDLPLWNRNQGNIKSSKILIEKSNLQASAQTNIIRTEVTAAYQDFQNYLHAFQAGELEDFGKSFNVLIASVAKNFTKGNINLLQFIDFFNSYTDNFNDQNNYNKALYGALNNLEYTLGGALPKN